MVRGAHGSSAVVTVSRRFGADQLALRARLIETAGQIAEKGGYDALSISTLADRASVTRPTDYRYFSGKDHVLLEVGKAAAAEIARQLATEDVPPGPRWQKVAHLLTRAVTLAQKRANLTAAFYCAVGSTQVVGEHLADQRQIFDAYLDGPLGTGVVREDEKNVLAHVYMTATLNLARGLVPEETVQETLTAAARLVLGPRPRRS